LEVWGEGKEISPLKAELQFFLKLFLFTKNQKPGLEVKDWLKGPKKGPLFQNWGELLGS